MCASPVQGQVGQMYEKFGGWYARDWVLHLCVERGYFLNTNLLHMKTSG